MLSPAERRLAGALMRVNHVGEVCAQALYAGQSAATSDRALKAFYESASAEEGDHLAWTRLRLAELGGRPSLLNPVWFGASFALGALAGALGDRWALGFMVETERQVERHLDGHLRRLPAHDFESRAVVEQMRSDEAAHAEEAARRGAAQVPVPVQQAMRWAARVMTAVAHRI